jgi:hypothetical protein
MAATGEDLLVLPVADGAAVQLCDAPDGAGPRVLVTVQEPVLVPVAGEVARLLDAGVAMVVSTPVWWVEVRAANAPESATDLAHRFTDALVARLGGVVWPTGVGSAR